MSITTVKLSCTADYDSHMEMHSSTVKIDISISKGFQNHLSHPTRKNGAMDQGKDRKQAITQKWTKRDYHVQYINDVPHTYVEISCSTSHLIVFPFCGMHVKRHVVKGLSKNYHFRLDHKLGHGNFEILKIRFACVEFINMLDKP